MSPRGKRAGTDRERAGSAAKDAARLSEAELQRHVIALARTLGWRVAHFRPGKTQRGNWVTPVQGDGAGFPDLIAVRGPRLLVAELKAQYRKPSPEQDEWLDRFRCLDALVTVAVWWPRDWFSGVIEQTLREDSRADTPYVGAPSSPDRKAL